MPRTPKSQAPAEQTAVEQPAAEAIRVDFGKLKFKDLVLFQRQDGELRMTPEVIEALDRAVVGGIMERSVEELASIMDAIGNASAAGSDPNA